MSKEGLSVGQTEHKNIKIRSRKDLEAIRDEVNGYALPKIFGNL